jgi:hypothetical protein
MAVKPTRPRDPNSLAHQIMLEATGQAPKPEEEPDTRNPHAVALSKLGASKGGHARAAALSATRKRAIAKEQRILPIGFEDALSSLLQVKPARKPDHEKRTAKKR